MIWIIIGLYLLGAFTNGDWAIYADSRPQGIEWVGFSLLVIFWPAAGLYLATRSFLHARQNRAFHKKAGHR